MNSWKKIIFAILITNILLLGIVTFLLGTAIGLRLVITTVNHLVPEIRIGKVSITNRFRILQMKNVRYEKNGIKANAEDLLLEIKLKPLFNRKLYVNDLKIKNIDLEINSEKIPISKKINKWDHDLVNFSKIHLVTFKRITLDNVHLTMGKSTVSIIHFSSGFFWKEKKLIFFPTTLQGVSISILKNNIILKKDKMQEEIHIPYLRKIFFKEKILGNSRSKFIFEKANSFFLPLDVSIQEFTGKQLHLISNTNLEVYHLLLKGRSINNCIQIDTLDINSNIGKFHVTGNSQLHHNWPISMTLNGSLNQYPLKREKIILDIKGELKESVEIKGNLYGFSDMEIRLKIWLIKKGIPLDLEIISKKFCWLLPTGEIQTNALKIRLKGKATDYILSFFAVIKGDKVPSSIITLRAKGDKEKMNINKLIVRTLNGTVKLIAFLDWKKDFFWRSEIKIDNINIEKKIPIFPFKIDGLFQINGRFYRERWEIAMSKIKLIGNAKENRISLAGSLKSNGYLRDIISILLENKKYSIPSFYTKWNLTELDLDMKIDAPRLNNIISGASGIAKGMLKIRSTVCESQLLSSVTISNLKWKRTAVSNARIGINVQSKERVKGYMNMYLDNITQPNININLATLSVRGNEEKHILQLRMRGDSISTQLYLKGNLNRQTGKWKGELEKISFDTPIKLVVPDKKITLDWSTLVRKRTIRKYCRKNPNDNPFFSKYANSEIINCIAINIHQYNLNNLMIPKIFWQGDSQQTNGVFGRDEKILLNAIKEKSLKNNLKLYEKNMKMAYYDVNNKPLVLVFDALHLNIWTYNNRIEISWLIHFTNGSQLDGRIKVNDLKKRRDLSGNINIQNLNFITESPSFSKKENIFGVFNANLRLTGNIESPKIFGKMQASGVDVTNSFIPFDIRLNQLTINFKGMHFTYLGIIRTQSGEINLSGTVKWRQLKNWHVVVIAKGKKIRIAIPSIGSLELSPNMIFEAMPRFAILNGYIEVPWARIVVHKIPDSAVPLSEDEIILDKNQDSLSIQRRNVSIRTNLVVHAGDDVYMDAFGVKARLTGDLRVVHNDQGFDLNGQINIPNGWFRTYGQDLIIRKGSMFFSGPLNYPIINIEAIRNPDSTENNVIVGIHVSSFANKPKVEIFSDPTMPKQEALSYFLRGRGLNKNQNDGTDITSILISLGIAQGDQIVGKIGEMLGVRNLMLDTRGVGDSSKVTITGYLLPDLQVRYGVGIFDSLATFMIRYCLIPKLYLEALSGADQVLNLLYKFEF